MARSHRSRSHLALFTGTSMATYRANAHACAINECSHVKKLLALLISAHLSRIVLADSNSLFRFRFIIPFLPLDDQAEEEPKISANKFHQAEWVMDLFAPYFYSPIQNNIINIMVTGWISLRVNTLHYVHGRRSQKNDKETTSKKVHFSHTEQKTARNLCRFQMGIYELWCASSGKDQNFFPFAFFFWLNLNGPLSYSPTAGKNSLIIATTQWELRVQVSKTRKHSRTVGTTRFGGQH